MTTQTQSIDGVFCSYFLLCAHEAEPHTVVTITRRVVVAITGTQVLRIVVPTTATYDAVRARNFDHYTIFNEFLKIDLLIESELT